ncbi:hypothetical protein ACHAW5_002324 [Stephanodiscus triporus]|uniref:Uncharacterized protein n=1 Tax=Stephanodiscus triporus TaxID=2934178 RepID=A0ABD3N782_9STRA
MHFANCFFIVASAVLSNINVGGGLAGPSVDRGGGGILGPGASVIELSVALDVPNRDDPNSILSVLDRLSRTARTDSRVGVQDLTSRVALELLRRKSSIVAAHARGRHHADPGPAQREYNGVAIRERGKFQRETVSRYGGVDYNDPSSSSSSSSPSRRRGIPEDDSAGKATVAVVTILMLIDGDSTSRAMPSRIGSVRDVEEALSRIAADAKADDCLRSAEILWTPEERDETLTMREVLADYPSLRSI